MIEANISSEALGSTMIAERMSVSVRQFYRKFKQVSDATPTEVIKQIRMKRAAELLLKGDQSVLDVMVQIGISSRSHFHREFLRTFGMPPIEYKKRNTGR